MTSTRNVTVHRVEGGLAYTNEVVYYTPDMEVVSEDTSYCIRSRGFDMTLGPVRVYPWILEVSESC